jgi:hypothetical protein
MDIIQWYAMVLAVIAALSIVFYLLRISISFLRTYATYHFLKHVFYPRVYKYVRGSTRFHVLLVIALIVGNVLCLLTPGINRLAGPDRTDFSVVWSQSKRPDRKTVFIFGWDRTETFISQAFINKLG